MPTMSDKAGRAFSDVTEFLMRCRLDRQDKLCFSADFLAWVCLVVTNNEEEALALLHENVPSIEKAIRANAENVARSKLLDNFFSGVKN